MRGCPFQIFQHIFSRSPMPWWRFDAKLAQQAGSSAGARPCAGGQRAQAPHHWLAPLGGLKAASGLLSGPAHLQPRSAWCQAWAQMLQAKLLQHPPPAKACCGVRHGAPPWPPAGQPQRQPKGQLAPPMEPASAWGPSPHSNHCPAPPGSEWHAGPPASMPKEEEEEELTII